MKDLEKLDGHWKPSPLKTRLWGNEAEATMPRLQLELPSLSSCCLLFAPLPSISPHGRAAFFQGRRYHRSYALLFVDITLSVCRPCRLFQGAMALETRYCYRNGNPDPNHVSLHPHEDGNQDAESMHHDQGEWFGIRDGGGIHQCDGPTNVDFDDVSGL